MIVETSNSEYVIDEEARTVARHPMGEHLRRDNEALTYLWMEEPLVGQSLQMLLDLRGDGVPTLRTTSTVLRVRREP